MSKQLWKARTHIITRYGWYPASQSASSDHPISVPRIISWEEFPAHSGTEWQPARKSHVPGIRNPDFLLTKEALQKAVEKYKEASEMPPYIDSATFTL